MSENEIDLYFSPDGEEVGSVSAASVPRYILYGDAGSRSDWFVNVERLERRGRERGWVIAPHTHPRFTQVMICTDGGGELSIDGETHAFCRGGVMVVPPFRIHGFHYTEDTAGWVLTVETNYLSDLLVRAPALKEVLGTSGALQLDGPVLGLLEAELARLEGELTDNRRGAAIGSEIHLLSVMLLLLRHWPERPRDAAATGARQALVERYRALVESRYRAQPALSDIAAELGVGVSQLRLACQQVAGLSPIAILHDRLLSEAKRCLAYTGMGVSEIAIWLGFADVSYFSRFFTKAVGKTPTAFRREQNFLPSHGDARHR